MAKDKKGKPILRKRRKTHILCRIKRMPKAYREALRS